MAHQPSKAEIERAEKSDDWKQMQGALKKVTGEGMSVQELSQAAPEQLGNDPQMEMVWAEKAGRHAEAHFKVLGVIKDKVKLRLTKIDDDLYTHFRRVFPKMKIDKIDEDAFKSKAAKDLWRPFCNQYEKLPDFNFGTLLRLDSSTDYDSANVTIVPRVQFFAIEIARNREGLNDWIGKAPAVSESAAAKS